MHVSNAKSLFSAIVPKVHVSIPHSAMFQTNSFIYSHFYLNIFKHKHIFLSLKCALNLIYSVYYYYFRPRSSSHFQDVYIWPLVLVCRHHRLISFQFGTTANKDYGFCFVYFHILLLSLYKSPVACVGHMCERVEKCQSQFKPHEVYK